VPSLTDRLDRLAARIPPAPPLPDLDWSRLTPSESAELVAINEEARYVDDVAAFPPEVQARIDYLLATLAGIIPPKGRD
jgi:hypothetical protein